MNSWQAIASSLARSRSAPPGVTELRIFGSALDEADPNDLDLLAVYDPGVVAPERANDLRPSLAEWLNGIELRLHFMLLTIGEAQSSRFAERERARLIWPEGP